MPDKNDSFGASMADIVAAKGEDLAQQAAEAKDQWSAETSTARDAVEEARAELSARAAQVKGQVSGLARAAVDRIDANRSTTADRLETAASALRDKSGSLPGGEKVTEAARVTADRLHATADYVRARDINTMRRDMVTLVKNHPGPSLMVAAAFGFLLGRATTRD
jgi:ElaB/YqjD/DUF883 family membrane-anchored ribosome-binding protein